MCLPQPWKRLDRGCSEDAALSENQAQSDPRRPGPGHRPPHSTHRTVPPSISQGPVQQQEKGQQTVLDPTVDTAQQ